MHTFEQFLEQKFMGEYHGPKDYFPDAFDAWLERLSVDMWLAYGDLFLTIELIDQIKEIREENYKKH